jgi:hypothetical protein
MIALCDSGGSTIVLNRFVLVNFGTWIQIVLGHDGQEFNAKGILL